MRRIVVVGLSAYLVLWATTSLHAADPVPAEDAPVAPWYKRIFSSSKPKPKREKIEKKEKPPTQKELSVSLQEEQKTYLERLQFCTRLRQIATETNNDELLSKADALEKMAEDVYQKKTNKLPDLLQESKAAEAALEQKRNAPASGTASNRANGRGSNDGSTGWDATGQPAVPDRVMGRAPNGRPIVTRE